MYNPGQPTSGNEVSATDKSIDFWLLMFAGGINKVVLGRRAVPFAGQRDGP